MNIEVTQFRAAILGTQLRSLERSGYADEPVADGLPVEGLVGHGGLVGEHGQNGGQVAAHSSCDGHPVRASDLALPGQEGLGVHAQLHHAFRSPACWEGDEPEGEED